MGQRVDRHSLEVELPQPANREVGSLLVDRPGADQTEQRAEELGIEMGRGVEVEVSQRVARGGRPVGLQERLDES